MKTRNRIITFTRDIKGIKKRFFVLRRVTYDDSMTPLYTAPSTPEDEYNSVLSLLKDTGRDLSSIVPILDLDHSLKTYDYDFSVER